MQRELLKSLLQCISVVIINIAFLDNFNTDCKYWYWNERSEGSCSHNPVFDCLQKLDRGESLGTRLKCQRAMRLCPQECQRAMRLCSQECQNSQPAIFSWNCDTLSCFHTWSVESGCLNMHYMSAHLWSIPFEVDTLRWENYLPLSVCDMMYSSNTWPPHQSFSFCCIIIEIWYSFHPLLPLPFPLPCTDRLGSVWCSA